MKEKVLVISGRNFGDAIIVAYLIKKIKLSNPGLLIDVFTRPNFIGIFNSINKNEINCVYTAEFPMGTVKNFGVKGFIALVKNIFNLRKNNYDFVINNIGDFRENILGRLISNAKNYAVIWPCNHPFSNLIRIGLTAIISNKINIPENILNIYQVQDYIAYYLSNKFSSENKLFKDNSRCYDYINIGVHPIASQKSRFWEYNNWVKLIENISNMDKKINIFIFCSQKELNEVKCAFSTILDKIEFISLPLPQFLNKLKSIDLFIGLDSFSIHSAYVMGVENIIMLNGANDARVWAPPTAHVIEAKNSCPYHPCYNMPKCLGTSYEYNCMKKIMIDDVLIKVKEII